MKTLTEKLQEVIQTLRAQIPGCVPVSVGGSVRDAVMRGDTDIEAGLALHSKDYDLEVFNAYPSEVEEVFQRAGIAFDLVGMAFPVYKVKGYAIDISFPRRENVTGPRHTDFDVEVCPNMTFAEASLRRDFTMNAMGYDWANKKLLDPHNGVEAIQQRLLRPVSEKFLEDALRVLRAFKFVARFGFVPSVSTLSYCTSMVPRLEGFARERLLGEWEDFILRCEPENVGAAFQFLLDCGAHIYYPELFNLRGVEQHPDHHPEGDVYKHTVHCFTEFCYIRGGIPEADRLIVGWAVLCHDMGKAINTQRSDSGVITAYGHECTPLARNFLQRMYHSVDMRIEEVDALVRAHMRPVNLFNTKSGLSGIRRLNLAVNGRIDRLIHVVWCDQFGRPGKPAKLEALTWLAEQNAKCGVMRNEKIQPIIRGRHILTHLKLEPGPRVGEIVRAMFETQLDGKFNDEASGIAYLKANFQA